MNGPCSCSLHEYAAHKACTSPVSYVLACHPTTYQTLATRPVLNRSEESASLMLCAVFCVCARQGRSGAAAWVEDAEWTRSLDAGWSLSAVRDVARSLLESYRDKRDKLSVSSVGKAKNVSS